MLKYELKKYILKPSVIICLAVLLLVNLVKVLEIYCQGSGRQILFSGKGRIEISKDVLYEKYGGENPSRTDGIKIYQSNGWVLIIPEKYRHCIKVITEGYTAEAANEISAIFTNQIKRLAKPN